MIWQTRAFWHWFYFFIFFRGWITLWRSCRSCTEQWATHTQKKGQIKLNIQEKRTHRRSNVSLCDQSKLSNLHDIFFAVFLRSQCTEADCPWAPSERQSDAWLICSSFPTHQTWILSLKHLNLWTPSTLCAKIWQKPAINSVVVSCTTAIGSGELCSDTLRVWHL